MEKPISQLSLEQIRKEIDAVDQAMLELLERRFSAIEAIRAIKTPHGTNASSPLRPAREAKILRRLLGLRRGTVPVQLMVRLWRSIISSATHVQANVSVHISGETAADHRLRDLVRDHFAPLAIRAQRNVEGVVREITTNALDVGVVDATSAWVGPLLESDSVKVMGVLPVIGRREERPQLLILGQAIAEPSGDDETVLAVGARTKLSENILWEARSGEHRCIAVKGFLGEQSPELPELEKQAVKILGQCPCPLEAHP